MSAEDVASRRREVLAQAHDRLVAGDRSGARELAHQAARLGDDAQVHALLGRLALVERRHGRACREYARAVELAPADAELAQAYAALLRSVGKVKEAAAVLDRACSLSPDNRALARSRGDLLVETGEPLKALAAYRTASQGGTAEMVANMGVALLAAGETEDAVAALRTAHLLQPDSPATLDNLGNALLKAGRPKDAESCHRRAAALNGNKASTLGNLGNALYRQGRLAEAEVAYRQALVHEPESRNHHLNLAMALLMTGRFAEGWKEYEWRWRGQHSMPRHLRHPDELWHGEDMPGGTLLLQAEQGFGDTIQYIRYAHALRPHVGRLVLCCRPELQSLMRTCSALDEVASDRDPLPGFDKAALLMSLPGLTATSSACVPVSGPYLSAPPGQGFSLPAGDGLAIGFAWAGRPSHGDDVNRTLPTELAAPLWSVPGTRWFSLQKWQPARRAGTAPPADKVVPLGGRLNDFGDTAAIIAQMDLVITVDTAVAHLAGALGKPVWTLLPAVPDWRWGMEGERVAFYPTMRLFRKRLGEDWRPVVAAVHAALRAMVDGRSNE